jgi:hypothetical protein
VFVSQTVLMLIPGVARNLLNFLKHLVVNMAHVVDSVVVEASTVVIVLVVIVKLKDLVLT